MTTITLQGGAAVDYAYEHDLTLDKYADPIEGARTGLTPEEAYAVVREDPRLITLTLRHTGAWTTGDGTWEGTNHEGYHVEDYFAGGYYHGPDQYGIEPVMAAAGAPQEGK